MTEPAPYRHRFECYADQANEIIVNLVKSGFVITEYTEQEHKFVETRVEVTIETNCPIEAFEEKCLQDDITFIGTKVRNASLSGATASKATVSNTLGAHHSAQSRVGKTFGVFSFRTECEHDALEMRRILEKNRCNLGSFLVHRCDPYPDTEVQLELEGELKLEKLIEFIEQEPNVELHVATETLAYGPREDNPMERTYTGRPRGY